MGTWLEIHHLILIIVALLLALLVVGGGKGLGRLVGPLIKKLLGKEPEVVVNIGGGDMAAGFKKDLPFDPSLCAVCEREQAGRIRNEKEIEKLWINYDKLLADMNTGFKELQASINTTKDSILSALAGDRLGYKKGSKGGEN